MVRAREKNYVAKEYLINMSTKERNFPKTTSGLDRQRDNLKKEKRKTKRRRITP